MTDLTPEAVKAALEAATPGPWESFMGDICAKGGDLVLAAMNRSCGARSSSYHTFIAKNPKVQDNARLIAMSPDLAAAYLAQAEEIERLRKRIDAADRLATEAQGLHADGLRVTSRALDIALATYRATEAKP